MEIRQLKAFLAIAEAKTFTAGARRVNVTQAAISMQIRQLEDEVGLQLFTRTPRRVILTEAGEYLLERARKILREHDSALAEIAEVAGAEYGRLRIGSASGTFAMNQLPTIMQKLKDVFPNSELSVSSGTSEKLVDRIMHGELDTAFISLPVDNTNVTTESLFSDEIVAIATSTHRHGLKLHMDGARFANAVAYVGCSPAELSWKAGVDVLSFGATKNGVMAAEAVVFFNAELARDFAFRSKRGGHLLSKMRLVSAQLDAYLSDGLWLDNARHANAMARRLVAGMTPLKGTQLMYPVDANEIFLVMPAHMHDALQDGGAKYHPWPSDRPGERAFRLVTAFDTDPADVDRFLSIAKKA